MKKRDSVTVGGATIDYEIRRSARRKKTIQITVSDGSVRVAAPAAAPDSELRAVVRKKAPWVLRQLSDTTPDAVPMLFVSGETLPYLGCAVPVVAEASNVRRPEARIDQGRFRIAVPKDLGGAVRREAVRRAVVAWYRDRAAEQLSAVVDRWWPLLGRGEKSRVLIRDQKRRWGSCASDGTLRFNWRIVMLKPSLMEYLVVHELAHLTHRNHSADFWGLVRKAMPDAQRRRTSLREAEGKLPL